MFRHTHRYPIAIDMSGHDIYAAQLRPSRYGHIVRGLACVTGNGNGAADTTLSETLKLLLKNLSKNRHFSGRKVVLHLPSRDISIFPLDIKLDKGEGLEEAIVRESGEYISFPLEEAIIDYPSLQHISSEDENIYRAIIIAARRSDIIQYLDIFKQSGFIVAAIDSEVSSLIRLHDYLYKVPENPVILCNIGKTQSLISVVARDSILVERHISWGINKILTKIQANLELGNDETATKTLLQRYGISNDHDREGNDGMDQDEDASGKIMSRIIYQVTMPYIEELTDEFHKINAYLRSDRLNAVAKEIYMYGQAVFIRGMESHFERRLNTSTTIANPMTKFPLIDDNMLSDPYEASPFGLALGLAMRNTK